MAPKKGGLALLNDPIAQELLRSTSLARLAYVWRDGTPRVVPIWFHWIGKEIILGTPPKAPKVRALSPNAKVALSIDGNTWPRPMLKPSPAWCRNTHWRQNATLARSKAERGSSRSAGCS
jgi:nitroimidazol reductase NimA-like FMN-containing flavoprotein (pyridoxamine 5'-phosphate oxidase superfamily)